VSVGHLDNNQASIDAGGADESLAAGARRIVHAEQAFADIVVWRLPKPVDGSAHPYK
jgi:hypothetical protein